MKIFHITKLTVILSVLSPLSFPAAAAVSEAAKRDICMNVVEFVPKALNFRLTGMPESMLQDMANGQDEPGRTLLSKAISITYEANLSNLSQSKLKEDAMANCLIQMTQMFG